MVEGAPDATITLLARLVADIEQFRNEMRGAADSIKEVEKTTAQTALTFSELSGVIFTTFRIMNRIEIAHLRLESAQNALMNTQLRYSEAVRKFGESSVQATIQLRLMEDAERNIETRQRRVMLSYVLVGTVMAAETARISNKLQAAGASALRFSNTTSALSHGVTRSVLALEGMRSSSKNVGASLKQVGIITLVAVTAFGLVAGALEAAGVDVISFDEALARLISGFKVLFGVLKMVGSALFFVGSLIGDTLFVLMRVLADFGELFTSIIEATILAAQGDFKGAWEALKRGANLDNAIDAMDKYREHWEQFIDAVVNQGKSIAEAWDEMVNGAKDAESGVIAVNEELDKLDSRRQDFVRLVHVLRDLNGQMVTVAGGIAAGDIGATGRGVSSQYQDNREYTVNNTNYNAQDYYAATQDPAPSEGGRAGTTVYRDYAMRHPQGSPSSGPPPPRAQTGPSPR